jgi:perosamine synthetase
MIPVYKPSIGDREKRYVAEALDSGWVSSKGAFLERFEKGFAEYLGAAHGISAVNGTASLHLAFAALGVGPGDEVIVPALTYIASVNAIAYTGAKPVFVDSDPTCWNLDPGQIEQAITPRTRAIEVVHLYGHPTDMDPILEVAARRGLYVVEDAAESHGALYKGRRVGAIGTVGSFSFFGNKIITTGEGGMLVTNDDELAAHARQLRGQGVSPTRTYWHDILGFNYRMTNVAAAMGCAQLERIDETLAAKKEIAGWYQRYLGGIEGLTLQSQAPWATAVYWMNSILVAPELRDPLRDYLAGEGIETRPFFHAAHTMPVYRSAESHPVAERLAASGINLPSFAELAEEQVVEICGAVRRFLESRRR